MEPGKSNWKEMGSHPANRWRVNPDEVDLSRAAPRPVRKVHIAAQRSAWCSTRTRRP